MKKLVNESLQELLSERFVEDPEVDGELEPKEEIEETEFTPEQKATIEEFIDSYEGDFEDQDIHDLAKELGLDKSEVEEYIYSLARDEEKEVPEESEEIEESSNVKGFHNDIEKDTLENDNFRKVLYTSQNLQLVLMTLNPRENIGMESHEADQFFRFEGGIGQCVINDNEYDIKAGDSILIPGGAEHDVINTSDEELLQMYTLYSPPNHVDGVVHETKEDADTAEKSGEDKPDGVTTE
jgi:mannose-6-phosphate isomerase-like protein (cupin superfamily)